MSPPLDGAVIGVGRIGERHARLLAEHPRTHLRAVIDLNEERAETVGTRYGADLIRTDPGAGLRDAAPDLTVVATPESDHLDSTQLALTHESHVLLEKPIAATVADADRIGELVTHADQELMVAYCCRFDPEYAGLKRRIEANDFGSILALQAARIGSVDSYAAVAEWTHTVYYLAVHDIDLLRWYLDTDITAVHAYASPGIQGMDTPAIISTTLACASGAVGTIETNWARQSGHPLELTQEIRLTGTEGYSRLVIEDDTVPVSTSERFDYAGSSELNGERRDMYRFQLDAFVEAIENGEPPPVTWRDGRESLRVANAIRTSIDEGGPVQL